MLPLAGLNPRDILDLQAGAFRQRWLGQVPKFAHPGEPLPETLHGDTSFLSKV